MALIKPSPEALQECMKNYKNIRNVCILAHVDHGKTTIADSLLATNRLVSKRMAGFLRYLDDRQDEQERGITMKSSAVSLLNTVTDESDNTQTELLLNLIDTPGHIDFSSEVSAALRVCDGAIILVDLVEGVCVQTREAIKQAFEEKTKMILILNKFDRLIVELHKDVDDIFQCILRCIEDCNATVAELYQFEYGDSEVDIEDSGFLFSPDTGNVIFASAIDGWGFTTKQISEMFINIVQNETVDSLNKKLWDFDMYVDNKTRSIKKGAIDTKKPNLFVQLCLKTIYYVYSTIAVRMEKDKLHIITEKLNIKTVTRDMSHNDSKVQIRAILQAWKPLAETIMLQCIKVIPSPPEISSERINYLLNLNKYYEDEYLKNCVENLLPHFKNLTYCEGTPFLGYVSKMFCVDKKRLSQNKPKIFVPGPRLPRNVENGTKIDIIKNDVDKAEKSVENTPPEAVKEEDNISIIALTRIFSGTLKIGQEIFVLSRNYVPNNNYTSNQENSDKNIQKIIVKELYMLFGRDLLLVDTVSAGNICGIGGLESAVIRTATLSSTPECVPFIERISIQPVVRNAIEPANTKDLPILRKGLRLLMQSDSCIQVITQETGEHVLLSAGDVHLAKCLEDLTTKFAQIEINVSSPMVSLRETIVHLTRKYDFLNDIKNEVHIETAQFNCTVIAVALPEKISKEIQQNYDLLRTIEDHQHKANIDIVMKRKTSPNELETAKEKRFVSNITNNSMYRLKDTLKKAFESSSKSWHNLHTKIWSIGKMNDSINLLFNYTSDYTNREIFYTLNEQDVRSCFDSLIVNAFNTCCKAGPLCEEPLMNCAFIIKEFKYTKSVDNFELSAQDTVSIDLALRNGFREAFEKQNKRLMEPMFITEIQVNTNILGKVYSVVGKRQGKVSDAVGMDDLEKTFLVKAQIPVLESVGFANEIRKTTSGQALPSLRFSHYEIIDGDPFYEPVSDDEDEEDTNMVESALRANKLMKDVRRRKGLQVDDQVVIHAEKQRTLNKKK